MIGANYYKITPKPQANIVCTSDVDPISSRVVVLWPEACPRIEERAHYFVTQWSNENKGLEEDSRRGEEISTRKGTRTFSFSSSRHENRDDDPQENLTTRKHCACESSS